MSWIACSVTLGDGRVRRYGFDEIEAEDRPDGFEFSTSNPGGFGAASITLPRPFGPSEWENQQNLYAHVEVYGPMGTVYEGFVSATPQASATSVTLQLSGWSAVLEKHETFRQIFVDRDLSRWGPGSGELTKDTLAAFNAPINEPAVETNTSTSLPDLKLNLDGGQVNAFARATYDAGAGQTIESIYYDMISKATASYSGAVGVMSDDEQSASSFTSDLMTGTNSSSSGTFTPSPDYRYGVIEMYLTGTVGSGGASMTLRSLAVFGNHGLTKRGDAPNQGYYQSDVLAYALDQVPSLTYSLGDSIEQTVVVIQHLTFTEDTSIRSVVEQMTALGGNQNVANDWGVYENREFYWKSPGTYGRTWYVRRDQVATDTSDGPDAERRVAGIKINYTDASGVSKSVGPPGSNSDYETTDLLDPDPDNPAHRIPGAFKSENIGIAPEEVATGFSQLAVNAGIMILNERNRMDWRGDISVTGEVEDQHGNRFPVSLIRAGDRIVVSDSPDTSPRTINSTSYDHASLTTTASIGAPPESLEAMLGQLALVTDLVAQ